MVTQEQIEKRKKYRKEYMRNYWLRPEVKARRKEYYARPDTKAKMKVYYKEYNRKKKEDREKNFNKMWRC